MPGLAHNRPRSSESPAKAAPSATKARSAGSENPIRVKIGRLTALKTAQPITGAAPSASTRGSKCRAMAYPNTLQNAVPTNAHRTALIGEAMENPDALCERARERDDA